MNNKYHIIIASFKYIDHKTIKAYKHEIIDGRITFLSKSNIIICSYPSMWVAIEKIEWGNS